MPDTARPRVLLLETIDDAALAELERGADVTAAWDRDAAAVIDVARVAPAAAIMTRGKGQVTAELMDAAAGLRVVARCGVGLDNVDVEAATARGVAVLNLPACNAQTMAEHTVMLMLAVTRGLVESAVAVRGGDWASRTRYDRDELNGKTLGVVGLGNIGGRVAAIAAAFGMRVVYADPAPRAGGWERVGLAPLLAESDVVTLHCQLDETTRHLLDATTLAQMKPGVVLINAARGGLVDHAALVDRLRSGALAGYGADVLDVEPPAADNPLLALPHVVITPHVGSLTRATYRDICVRSVRNVLAVLAGEPPEAGCVFNGAALGG
ncbi:MAG: hydroxyacid dehydrogenase [Phycisphaerae bacterium]|nr:hydroxyacid dehydrogenase [Phycisphaerae bacterium]